MWSIMLIKVEAHMRNKVVISATQAKCIFLTVIYSINFLHLLINCNVEHYADESRGPYGKKV